MISLCKTLCVICGNKDFFSEFTMRTESMRAGIVRRYASYVSFCYCSSAVTMKRMNLVHVKWPHCSHLEDD